LLLEEKRKLKDRDYNFARNTSNFINYIICFGLSHYFPCFYRWKSQTFKILCQSLVFTDKKIDQVVRLQIFHEMHFYRSKEQGIQDLLISSHFTPIKNPEAS